MYILLKFMSEKNYLKDFLDGHLYMNSLYYFWNQYILDLAKKNRGLEEKEVDIAELEKAKNRGPGPGQIDLFEGTVTTEQAQNASIPDEFKNYAVADVVYRSIGMGYCNVLCFYKMDYKVVGRNLIDFQLGEMDEFGKYVVIIDDMSELERRIYLAARKQGFKCLCGPVRYRELKLNGGDIRTGHNIVLKEDDELYDISKDDSKRDAFDKMSNYSYQKEWRVALCRGEKDIKAYNLSVGNLRDIVHWVKQEELKSEIKRMFQNNQIKANSGNWYGDDRHELREKLYQLGDDKAERFIIVGGKNA